jgi:hypothetical protein
MRQDLSALEKRHRQARMLAWWYITIGGAFILLGLRSVLRADSAWPIAFRFLIAVGFIVLGVGTLRTPSR